MRNDRRFWMVVAALLGSLATALAQPAPPAAASAPESMLKRLPELPLSCAEATSRAMSADVKVAQSAQLPLEALIHLQETALSQWRVAVGRCEGRARERAQRLLDDNLRARQRLAEREQAGSQCELTVSDAKSLQGLAESAFRDSRWLDAGALYRKAETLWDLGAELCTGEQQQEAARRRVQAEVDAHNAEECAPGFDRARELSGRLRALAANVLPADRERSSQIAETAWRAAIDRCKGPAKERAQANAEAVARERGTPWVQTAAPEAKAAEPERGSGFATAAAPQPPPGESGLLERAGAAAGQAMKAMKVFREAVGTAAAVQPAPALSAAPPAAAQPLPASTDGGRKDALPDLPAGEVELQAGGARYLGRFALDAARQVGGEGRVVWDHGDRYEGRLLAGKRVGKGRFQWASGQQYDGDWVDDEPQGAGRLQFANGDAYEGQVSKGRPEGLGEMRYASGDLYRGQFRGGMPLGRGLYRWANGQSFEGDWIGLTPQGRGVLRFANGNHYEGEVKDGVPEGQGRMQYANGGVYQGQFKAGLSEGRGIYVWPGGDRYEGDWQQGRKHGQGSFFFASGERWVGRFENDERSDDGVFHGK